MLVTSYGYNSMFVAAAVVMGIGMLSMLLVRPGVFREEPAPSLRAVTP